MNTVHDPPPALSEPRAVIASRARLEPRLKLLGEGLHPLKDGSGWRTYSLTEVNPKTGKLITTGIFSSLEGLCEVRGWLPMRPPDTTPLPLPAPADQHLAQALRRALLPQGIGLRPFGLSGDAPDGPSVERQKRTPTRGIFNASLSKERGWVSYRLAQPLEVLQRAETLEKLAALHGVDLALPMPAPDEEPLSPELRAYFCLCELEEHPERQRAWHTLDTPLLPEPGEPVSVVLAIRQPHGSFVTGEVLIPRERFVMAAIIEVLEQASNLK